MKDEIFNYPSDKETKQWNESLSIWLKCTEADKDDLIERCMCNRGNSIDYDDLLIFKNFHFNYDPYFGKVANIYEKS